MIPAKGLLVDPLATRYGITDLRPRPKGLVPGILCKAPVIRRTKQLIYAGTRRRIAPQPEMSAFSCLGIRLVAARGAVRGRIRHSGERPIADRTTLRELEGERARGAWRPGEEQWQ